MVLEAEIQTACHKLWQDPSLATGHCGKGKRVCKRERSHLQTEGHHGQAGQDWASIEPLWRTNEDPTRDAVIPSEDSAVNDLKTSHRPPHKGPTPPKYHPSEDQAQHMNLGVHTTAASRYSFL
jgi:hypothetical protein